MLDLIYIVEDSQALDSSDNAEKPYQQNFVLAGHSQAEGAASAVSAAAVAGAIVGASSLFTLLPTALVISAVSQTPSLLRLIKNQKAGATDAAGTSVVDGEAKTLASFVNKHAMSPGEAKARGYLFQPGHPIVGKAYKKHPLADYTNAKKSNLYIPSDSYDAILLEERESELLKLLVHLGATRISITRKTSDLIRKASRVNASVDVALKGGAELGYTGTNEGSSDSLDTRDFSLTGKPWVQGTMVAEEQFFWLAYEPSWGAVVFAREHGGCLSASLEIKETTSFSTDKSVELSVKAKLVEAGVSGGLSSLDSAEKTYYIKAEFAPVLASL